MQQQVSQVIKKRLEPGDLVVQEKTEGHQRPVVGPVAAKERFGENASEREKTAQVLVTDNGGLVVHRLERTA